VPVSARALAVNGPARPQMGLGSGVLCRCRGFGSGSPCRCRFAKRT